MPKILSNVLEQFVSYAKFHAPNEACGLFVTGNSQDIIDNFIPIKNISSDKDKFEFSPQEYIKAIYEIESANTRLSGITHSHPNSNAYPSKMDLDNWFYPDLSYWIYSLQDDIFKAFLIKNKKVKEIYYDLIISE